MYMRITFEQRQEQIRQKKLAAVAHRTFAINSIAYHTGTMQQWFDFEKEFKSLLEKHKVTSHCFDFTLIRINGKLTEIAKQ